MEEGQPSWQGQPSLPRSRVSVKFFVKICFRLYARGGPALLGGISLLSIDYRDLAYRKAGNFHINASQSCVHTTKVVLTSIFQITFHFTSSVCLCVGYKMNTFTPITDSGLRRKINVVSPGDSAKGASPGRRAGPPPRRHPLRQLTLIVYKQQSCNSAPHGSYSAALRHGSRLENDIFLYLPEI